MAKVIAERFEAEQAVREHRLADLEAQINRLKAELAERRRNRDNVVRDMVERIIKTAKDFARSKLLPSAGAAPPTSQPAGSKSDK